jgi:hypothetical protein
MGIKGETTVPSDPSQGLAWRAIVDQVDRPGTESRFVSVADMPRQNFHKHPWSIGGGGAAELKELLDDACDTTLDALVASVGPGVVLGEDGAFSSPAGTNRMRRLPPENRRILMEGKTVRDWVATPISEVLFPYSDTLALQDTQPIRNWLWPMRTLLKARLDFSKKTYAECGRPFWEYHQIPPDRNLCSLLITFADVATHNHFVLIRTRAVFGRTAPIIHLSGGGTEEVALALLGLLNSSIACFWLKQVIRPKGGDHVGTEGARVRTTLWDERFAHDGTKVRQLPVPNDKPTAFARELDRLGQELKAHTPTAVLAHFAVSELNAQMDTARTDFAHLRGRMIALQEELDWECYRHYGLLAENMSIAPALPEFSQVQVKLGERAFEIVMARSISRGELETVWFSRHNSAPVTEVPAHWPVAYRQLVERRIARIETDRNIALIEQPEYKRRWNTEPWEQQQERALRQWLLTKLEDRRYWPGPELTSCAHLADKVRGDTEFMEVSAVYRARPDFDLTELVVELVEGESAPFLPVLRYKESGLRKRAIWEQVWEMQRQEDAIDARTQLAKDDPNYLPPAAADTLKKQRVGGIPVPPRYDTKDFGDNTCWRLRGELDVPEERFITYPHCNRDADRTPVIGWAGWDHLQQAQAVAGYYERMRTNEGWTDDRLLPLLAGVLELLPWLLQWHNVLDPQYGMGLGDFYRSFTEEEARRMGKTLDEVRAWQPPAKPGRKKKGT